MNAFDPFGPLGEAPQAMNVAVDTGDLEPLTAPDGVEPPTSFPGLGQCSKRWAYRSATGELQGYVCRFETPEGKETRPLRYGIRKGRERWHWKGWREGRPLYRLPELLASADATVLVVEGEKSADAAARLLPDFAAVTSMNGARSPGKSDWSPVAGRDVVIWPDNDEPGEGYARAVAAKSKAEGATTVRIVAVPDGAAEGWDLADELPEGWAAETIRAAIAAAEPYDPSCAIQGNLKVQYRGGGDDAPGLYLQVEEKDPETGEVVTKWLWFASRIDVIADTRDHGGEQWGRLLGVHDRDGNVHQWAMPMEMLAGSGETYRQQLYSLGMTLRSGGSYRQWLTNYLSSWKPRSKVRCVDRIGWHGGAYVLPDRTYGAAGERVILQVAGSPPALMTLGSLQGWQDEIAAPAAGNSRLLLAISAAFAAPLLYLAGEESGGVHLMGASSMGKTTALHVARSVSGAPLASWRTTDNAAEAMARAACDGLLPLDEIGQAPAHVIEAMAYMLGNGSGKARMRKDISNRAPLVWRVLFLSTGELGLAAKLNEGGRRAMAGQLVRVLDLPADAGSGLGIFDTLHGAKSAAALAEHLRLAADRNHGHALRSFLGQITRRVEDTAELAREARQTFLAERCPLDADGQVRRAAGRFALIAAAGELATAYGVVPWMPGEAEAAAARCFNDWLAARGGSGPAEIIAALRQVRLFLEQHGSSRFEPAWVVEDGIRGSAGEDAEVNLRKTIQRAGFRRTAGEGNWTFYVLPEVWAVEICKGFNHHAVAKAMAERGWLRLGDGRNLAQSLRVPDHGKLRLFAIPPSFLAGEDG